MSGRGRGAAGRPASPARRGPGAGVWREASWNGRGGRALFQCLNKANTTEAMMKPGETPSRVLIYLALFSVSVVLLLIQLG